MRRVMNRVFRRSLLAYTGAAMLLVGLATVFADGGTAAAASSGANFVATGHDMDFHCADAAATSPPRSAPT